MVPILERHDLIGYLLAILADEPGMRDAELVFVLSDPARTADVVGECRHIQPLYGLPFRLVTTTKALGVAGAINAGARAARAPVLVLLDSHVIPDEPGWLARLLVEYAELPGQGAIGPRLLRSDGSLNSEGVVFVDDPSLPGLWSIEHPGQGLPPAPPSAMPQRVAAMSGACVVLSRDLFQRVGGLDEGYLLGHFADTDLCLKLRQAGCFSHVAQEVTMTSISAMTAPENEGAWSASMRLFDAWLLNRRWQGELAGLAEEFTARG